MGSLAYRQGAIAALGLLVFGVGCKQILGLHERTAEVSGDDGGGTMQDMPDAAPSTITVGSAVPLRYPSPECAACMDAKCVTEAQACHADSSCDPEFGCFLDCGDDGACRSRCASFFSRSDAIVGITTCRQKNCATECASNCGSLNYNTPGCDKCVHGTCCEAASNCAKNPECLQLDVCRSQCLAGSTSCQTDCESQHPNGVMDYAGWNDCTQNACGQACSTGNSWSCLGSAIVWPKPRSLGKITFSATIVDLLLEVPYAKVMAKACSRTDPLCTNPLDTAQADDNGLVTVTVPAGATGFDGYIELTGGDSSGGAGDDAGADGGTPSPIFPALWYPSPPVISGGWRGWVLFPSAKEIPILASFVGTTIDPNRGHFAANASDCNFSAAPGVSFASDQADKDTSAFYFLNGNPDMTAHETDSESAIGGFVNLPPGFARITATANSEKKSLGQQQFTIRAGTFTTSAFAPQPSK
jgi:hypothetical protein